MDNQTDQQASGNEEATAGTVASDDKHFEVKCNNCNTTVNYKILPNYCALCGCKFEISQEELNEKEATAVTAATETKLHEGETITPEQFWNERSELISRFRKRV